LYRRAKKLRQAAKALRRGESRLALKSESSFEAGARKDATQFYLGALERGMMHMAAAAKNTAKKTAKSAKKTKTTAQRSLKKTATKRTAAKRSTKRAAGKKTAARG
jgi:hypothetical protein